MAQAKTEGFRWLPSYYEAVRDLPDKERLAIYDAIIDYGFGNDVQELSPLLNGYFRLMQPSLEKSIRFEIKQRENGTKGGRPSKTQPKPKGNPEETQNDFGENLAIAVAVDSAVAVESAVEKNSGKPQHKHGEFGWVMLTDQQYQNLLQELGQPELDRCIRHIDEAAQSSGNKNRWRDWNLVIRRCHREGWGMNPKAADTWPSKANIPRAY